MKNTKISRPLAALINSKLIIISSIMFFGIQDKTFASGARLPFFSTSKNQITSTNQAAATAVKKNIPIVNKTIPVSQKTNVNIPDKYAYLDPGHEVPSALLSQALNYYESHQNIIKNKSVLGIVDFKQHSSKERFYIVNIETGQVEKYLVAHGKNSDPDFDGYATIFSNNQGSLMSSVGFYITAETYDGNHGYSLMLDGLSSTNSNARVREIVMHPADYVSPGDKIGRSWGCLAMEPRYSAEIINQIKGGSIIYATNVY